MKYPLLNALEHCLIDAVCEVGVDLILAVQNDHLSSMLAFVGGLGKSFICLSCLFHPFYSILNLFRFPYFSPKMYFYFSSFLPSFFPSFPPSFIYSSIYSFIHFPLLFLIFFLIFFLSYFYPLHIIYHLSSCYVLYF